MDQNGHSLEQKKSSAVACAQACFGVGVGTQLSLSCSSSKFILMSCLESQEVYVP